MTDPTSGRRTGGPVSGEGRCDHTRLFAGFAEGLAGLIALAPARRDAGGIRRPA